MEALEHLYKHAQTYGLVALGILILVGIILVLTVNTYEMHLFRNMFRLRREGFQNQAVVSGGEMIPDTIVRESCQKLKDHIANYEKVKLQHKDVPITNLDETLTIMKEYFVSYNCE